MSNTPTTIEPGDYVRVEHTLGTGTQQRTSLVEGIAFLDAEGTLRVSDPNSDWEVNLDTDPDGYHRRGVLLLSVDKPTERTTR